MDMSTTPTLVDTSAEIARLARRLDDGYHMIDQRRQRGEDVTMLEDFWIRLLHQYEALCLGHRAAA